MSDAASTIRLLLVEDSDDDARILLHQLRKEFADVQMERVDTAEGMRTALVEREWDLVISDHRMPQFSALEALQLLQEEDLDLPFIIVSGAIGEETAVEVMRAGANDYLLKGDLLRLPPVIRRELRDAAVRQERRQAQADLLRYHERLQILHDVDRALLAAASREEIADSVLERLRSLLECDSAVVLTIDGDNARILAESQVKGSPCVIPGSLQTVNLGDLSSFQRGETTYANDVGSLQEYPRVLQALHLTKAASFVAAPIKMEGDRLALLVLCSSRPSIDLARNVQIATEVADQLAVVLRQTRMHEQIRQHARHLEDRVEERTRELQSANANLEAYSHSVSHDLRAPLRAIHGYAVALQEDLDGSLNEDAQHYLEQIESNCSKMERLIEDLLLYSQIGSGTLEVWPVNLSDVIEQVLEDKSQLISNRDASVVITSEMPRIMGDRGMLMHVIAPILENALLYVPPSRSPEISISCRILEDEVRLIVQDNGAGIPEGERERIFFPFVRLDNGLDVEGNGLGLAIARKAIDRMGGSIRLSENVEAPGTAVEIRWPRRPKE